METVINFIMSAEGLKVILAIVGLASAIATITPNKVDNKVIDAIMKIINALGMNFGNAKNK